MERSIESHNAIASINADEVSPFLDSVVEHSKDTALTALREVLNGEIAKLGIDSNPNDILTLRNRLGFFVSMAKELKARLDDEVFVQWLTHNGDLEVGDIRYYAGVEKTTKPVLSNRALLEILFEACGGDFDRMAELLASGAFKPAACKKVLDEGEWRKAFTVTEASEVREGKPQKRVLEINQRFVK